MQQSARGETYATERTRLGECKRDAHAVRYSTRPAPGGTRVLPRVAPDQHQHQIYTIVQTERDDNANTIQTIHAII
nr:MAG TPA: hypothetical protein [Caudoviricetes sp.]